MAQVLVSFSYSLYRCCFVYLGGLQDEILRQVKVAVSFLVVVITPTTDAYFNYMKLRRILERRKLNR